MALPQKRRTEVGSNEARAAGDQSFQMAFLPRKCASQYVRYILAESAGASAGLGEVPAT
jgi:hypothetical protein